MKLLLLGESNVGKTHFGGQLLGRLNQEQGNFKMVGSPSTLAPFEAVLDGLNNGRASDHTSAELYLESVWHVANAAGDKVDLVWPDYGGEQVRAIRDDRRMPKVWRERIQGSDGWIVMVRIQHTQLTDDIFSRPLDKMVQRDTSTQSFALSDQAKLIDFIQWLMFVRGCPTLRPTVTPQLLMLLSCWDELPESQRTERPSAVLANRMPLVSAFLQSNWEADKLHILGLSALERPLRKDVADDDYVDRGPEAFGYVVNADGSHDADLTLAIAPLIGL